MPEFIYEGRVYYNPVEFAMNQIGGTWKIPILWRLNQQVMRYSELKRSLPKISDKMLSSQLKELEKNGLVHREVYAVVPPKTEYSLTEKGQRAMPIIHRIRDYGLELMEEAGISHT